MDQHLLDAYHNWYYHSGIWKRLSYRGIRTLKLPSDLWNYQEIIYERDIGFVVETGTRHGGSALFFADLIEKKEPDGFVVSIDVDDHENRVRAHPKIHFLIGDSASLAVVGQVSRLLPAERKNCFWIFDSDHRAAHVLSELHVWAPVMKPGDYLVVEDSNINGHPVRPDFGPGPWEAVQQFMKESPGTFVPDTVRERKFGITFAPSGFLVRSAA